MPSRLPRRRVLRTSLVGLATVLLRPTGSHLGCLVAAESSAGDPAQNRLTAYQDGPHIWVRWQNEVVISYRAHPSQKYPYFYPLAGPVSGLSLTAETALPWPHHRSLLFACDRVNGANYWQGPVQVGQIVSQGPQLGASTEHSVEILDQCSWAVPGQPAAMRDERRFVFRILSDHLRCLDAEILWQAVQDVTIEKTNHSLFALRAAPDITPLGSGQLTNAEGLSGEKATFGQASAWCAFWGPRRGVGPVEGIALFDHPQNPWAPTPWFTRDYGFISPTPFQFIDKPWRLQAGDSVRLRYRVVLFAGTPEESELTRNYQEWIAGSTAG